jgi:hypothetical protein
MEGQNKKMEKTPTHKELEAENAKGLYKSCLDIMDILLTKTPESEQAGDFAEIMKDFEVNQPLTARAYPKTKGWSPRHNWKTGEHSGFVVQIRNEKGQTLYMNIYGGLRVATKGDDFRDSDRLNTRCHNFRTEDVLCNATTITLGLIDEHGQVQTQVKFFRNPDRIFFLRSIKIKTKEGFNERAYSQRRIVYNHSDYHFDQVSQGFAEQCNYFTSSIESSIKN